MKLLTIELGGCFFDGTAEYINEFFGEDIVQKRTIVTVENKKGDKRVEFVLHNRDSNYENKIKTIENGKDFSCGEIKETKKRKKKNAKSKTFK